MFDPESFETIRIHQENLRRQAYLSQVLWQAGLSNPSLVDRVLPMLGDTLIHIGLKIKERASIRLATEQASVPTFLIML